MPSCGRVSRPSSGSTSAAMATGASTTCCDRRASLFRLIVSEGSCVRQDSSPSSPRPMCLRPVTAVQTSKPSDNLLQGRDAARWLLCQPLGRRLRTLCLHRRLRQRLPSSLLPQRQVPLSLRVRNRSRQLNYSPVQKGLASHPVVGIQTVRPRRAPRGRITECPPRPAKLMDYLPVGGFASRVKAGCPGYEASFHESPVDGFRYFKMATSDALLAQNSRRLVATQASVLRDTL